MNNLIIVGCLCGLATVALANLRADEPGAPADASTRYGLFNGLDHRSFYEQGNFPEPFLVDDSGLEVNEARLDWMHSKAKDSRSDSGKIEIEKGFGLLTLEVEVPYERDVSDGQTTKGFDNIDIGARYPFYQFVSAKEFFDTTLGVGIEVGIPVNSAVSKNTELVPKIFNDTKIGEHFTMQTVLGYSALFGGGEDGAYYPLENCFCKDNQFKARIQEQSFAFPPVVWCIMRRTENGGKAGIRQK